MTSVPEHTHPELERRLDRIEQRLDRIDTRLDRAETRSDRIEDLLQRMSIEIGMIIETLNEHTRTLAEIRNMLRRRNGDSP